MIPQTQPSPAVRSIPMNLLRVCLSHWPPSSSLAIYNPLLPSSLFISHCNSKSTNMASSTAFLLPLLFAAASLLSSAAANFHQSTDITWGDGRAQILNNGDLLSLSLDRASGSGFRSRNEYLYGKIDMQIKLVPGNSAGTVTAYYVRFTL